MKQKYKNLTKLLAFSSLMTGCVMRSPKAYESEKEFVENGKVYKKKIVSYGNARQYTPLGNIWNAGTYGVWGTGWGIVDGFQQGFSGTNSSYVVRTFDGTYRAVKGVGTGLYKGINYGFNMEYQNEKPVEEKAIKAIEDGSNYFFQKLESISR